MNRRGRRGLAALLAALVLTLSLSGCGGRRVGDEETPLGWAGSDWTMAEDYFAWRAEQRGQE